MKKLIVIGAGNLAKLTFDIVYEMNKINNEIEIIGFIDDFGDNSGKEIMGVKYLGTTDYLYELNVKDYYFICAIANPRVKKSFIKILDNLGARYINLIHPTAIVSDFAKLSKGIIVNCNSILAIDCKINNHVFINFNCTIGHDVIIEKFCSLMPSVNIAGNVFLKECAYLGMDSTVLEKCTIGFNSIIGANALVNKDIEDNVTAVGIPAKIIRRN